MYRALIKLPNNEQSVKKEVYMLNTIPFYPSDRWSRVCASAIISTSRGKETPRTWSTESTRSRPKQRESEETRETQGASKYVARRKKGGEEHISIFHFAAFPSRHSFIPVIRYDAPLLQYFSKYREGSRFWISTTRLFTRNRVGGQSGLLFLPLLCMRYSN